MPFLPRLFHLPKSTFRKPEALCAILRVNYCGYSTIDKFMFVNISKLLIYSLLDKIQKKEMISKEGFKILRKQGFVNNF